MALIKRFLNLGEWKSLCAKIYFDNGELEEIILAVLAFSDEQAWDQSI